MKTSMMTLGSILVLLLTPNFLTAKVPEHKLTFITSHGTCIEYVYASEKEVEDNHPFNYKEVLKEERLENRPMTSSSLIDISGLIKEEKEVAEPEVDSLIILERIQSGSGNAR
ncbi:MAG: hypothetical protein ACOCYD_01890 [bacterium]